MKYPNITQGEWQIFANTGKITTNKGSVIADVAMRKDVKAISAVPEMIDTLIEAKEYLTIIVESSGWNPDHDSCIKNIRKSLKKAGVEL